MIDLLDITRMAIVREAIFQLGYTMASKTLHQRWPKMTAKQKLYLYGLWNLRRN